MTRRAAYRPRPWTAEEDEKLREIMQIGLASEFWPQALPGRTHGDVCERRLDLQVPIAPLL